MSDPESWYPSIYVRMSLWDSRRGCDTARLSGLPSAVDDGRLDGLVEDCDYRRGSRIMQRPAYLCHG